MLNNNGWGLRVAIAFTFIFVLCLVFASILINRAGFFDTKPVLDNGINQKNIPEDSSSDEYYENLETTVYEAIQNYSNDNPDLLSDKNSVIVNISKLKSDGYLTTLEDATGRECDGYAEVFLSNTTNYSVYISCPNYKTTGYDERKDYNE